MGRTLYFKAHPRVTGTKFLLRGICIVFIPEVKNRVRFRLVRKANDGFLERVASAGIEQEVAGHIRRVFQAL